MRKGFIKDIKMLKGLLLVLPLLSVSVDAVEAVSHSHKTSNTQKKKNRAVRKSIAGQKAASRKRAIRIAAARKKVREKTASVKRAQRNLGRRRNAKALARRNNKPTRLARIKHNIRHVAKPRLSRAQRAQLAAEQHLAALLGQQHQAQLAAQQAAAAQAQQLAAQQAAAALAQAQAQAQAQAVAGGNAPGFDPNANPMPRAGQNGVPAAPLTPAQVAAAQAAHAAGPQNVNPGPANRPLRPKPMGSIQAVPLTDAEHLDLLGVQARRQQNHGAPHANQELQQAPDGQHPPAPALNPFVAPAATIPDDQLIIPGGAADQLQPAVNQLGIESQLAQNFVQTLLLQDQELQSFVQGLTQNQALLFGAVSEAIYLHPGEDFSAIMGKNIKNKILKANLIDMLDTLSEPEEDQVGEMIRKIHNAVNPNGMVPPAVAMARPTLDDLFQAPASSSSSSSSEEDSPQQELSFSLDDLNNAAEALDQFLPKNQTNNQAPAVEQLGIASQLVQKFVQDLLPQDQEVHTLIQGLTEDQASVFRSIFAQTCLHPGEEFLDIMNRNKGLRTKFLAIVDPLSDAQKDQVGEMVQKVHQATQLNPDVMVSPMLAGIFQAPSSSSSSSSSEEDSPQQEFNLDDLNNASQALSHLYALEQDVDFDLDNDSVSFDLASSNASEEDVDYSLVDPENVKQVLNLLSNSDDNEDNMDNSSPEKPQKMVDLDREDDVALRIRNALRHAQDLDID